MCKMPLIPKKTWKKCCVKTAVFNNLKKNIRKLWLKMHDIQDTLSVKNMSHLTRKKTHCIFDSKNPTEEQILDYKSWFNDGLYIITELALKIIMYSRLSSKNPKKFRSELGFKRLDLIMTKEQSVLKSVKDAFEGGKMNTHTVTHKIDLYFHDYKLAIENDEKGYKYRDIKHEIKRQKAIEKKLDCKFIEINLEKESFNISKPMNEVHRHITSQLKSLHLTRF